ncbi:MAG: hypothetical protein K6E98_09705 [Lachnospiraceae bacterium]|nr:hypothetical protein [Lachnospiraceae bacterium]
MSKSFEEEYKKYANTHVPDLFDRIEAGIDRLEAQESVQTFETEKISKGPSKKRIFDFSGKYMGIIAAAACGVLAVSVYGLTKNAQKMGSESASNASESMYEAETEVAAEASEDMYEPAQKAAEASEDMYEPVQEAAEATEAMYGAAAEATEDVYDAATEAAEGMYEPAQEAADTSEGMYDAAKEVPEEAADASKEMYEVSGEAASNSFTNTYKQEAVSEDEENAAGELTVICRIISLEEKNSKCTLEVEDIMEEGAGTESVITVRIPKDKAEKIRQFYVQKKDGALYEVILDKTGGKENYTLVDINPR